MKTQLFIFGFMKQNQKLIKFKNKHFKFVEGYFEHLQVSIEFKTTKKKATTLRYFLEGVRRQFYTQGYTLKKADKILRKLENILKQVNQQLNNHNVWKDILDCEIHNVTHSSLFALVLKCEPISTSSEAKKIKLKLKSF